MVTDRYQHLEHHATVEQFVTSMVARELTVVGIDNLPGGPANRDHPVAKELCFGFRTRRPWFVASGSKCCGTGAFHNSVWLYPLNQCWSCIRHRYAHMDSSTRRLVTKLQNRPQRDQNRTRVGNAKCLGRGQSLKRPGCEYGSQAATSPSPY